LDQGFSNGIQFCFNFFEAYKKLKKVIQIPNSPIEKWIPKINYFSIQIENKLKWN
jgi:hypothetical protein